MTIKIKKNPNNKETKSPGLDIETIEIPNKEDQDLKAQMDKVRSFYYTRLENARDNRNQARPELDGLDFETDHETNKRAANGHLPPKNNDDEVRIVTGTTEKKIETVMNELLSINFQPSAQVYDKDDNEIRNLGDDFMDIVTRTNQIEKDEKVWKTFIRELVTQRAAFIEEVDDYQVIINRGITKVTALKQIVKEQSTTEIIHRAIKRPLSVLQVYLGNVNLPSSNFQEQPFVVKYYRGTYDEKRVIYQNWDNWKYVKPGNFKMDETNPYKWRLNTIENNEVEEIHYIDPWNDEYMIILNGVLMFDEPAPCPYTITTDRKYNMSMATLKDMGMDYAYGKPLTASSKTLQGVNSEMIRLLIEKFRQAIKPAMATNSKKIFSKDIFTAGSMTYGIKRDDIFPINPNQQQGITSGEFNAYNLIEQKTEEFIGGGTLDQSPGKGTPTATEIVNSQRQFIKNLGFAVLAITEAKTEATYLRLYNILENFTSPVKREFNPLTNKIDDVYKRFTITNGQFSDGKTGKKIIQFTDKPLEQEQKEQIKQFQDSEELAGRNVRIRTINTKMLNSIPLFWYVTVEPKERDGSALEKVLYTEKLNQAAGLSKLLGIQLNPDTWKDDFSFIHKVKKPFMDSQQPVGGAQEEQGNEMMGELDKLKQSVTGDQLKEGQLAGSQKPSINTIGQQ